jgi:chromosome segregation ATPase
MVNENHRVFGIELVNAEQTMKLMFARLAPISGLRKRIAEAEVMVKNIQQWMDAAKKNELELEAKVLELTKARRVARNPWLRRRLDTQIAEKKQELIIQRDRRRFFAEQLYREKQLSEYFRDQLDRQARQLKVALQEASALRERLKSKTNKLASYIEQVKKEHPEAKQLTGKMLGEMRRVRESHQKAAQLVKQIQTELESEREESKDLRYRLANCQLQKSKPCIVPQCNPPKATKRLERKSKPQVTKPRHSTRRPRAAMKRRPPKTLQRILRP